MAECRETALRLPAPNLARAVRQKIHLWSHPGTGHDDSRCFLCCIFFWKLISVLYYFLGIVLCCILGKYLETCGWQAGVVGGKKRKYLVMFRLFFWIKRSSPTETANPWPFRGTPWPCSPEPVRWNPKSQRWWGWRAGEEKLIFSCFLICILCCVIFFILFCNPTVDRWGWRAGIWFCFIVFYFLVSWCVVFYSDLLYFILLCCILYMGSVSDLFRPVSACFGFVWTCFSLFRCCFNLFQTVSDCFNFRNSILNTCFVTKNVLFQK